MKSKRFNMKLFLVKVLNLKKGDRLKADSILPERKFSFQFVLSCVCLEPLLNILPAFEAAMQSEGCPY